MHELLFAKCLLVFVEVSRNLSHVGAIAAYEAHLVLSYDFIQVSLHCVDEAV